MSRYRHIWVVERERQWGIDTAGTPLIETVRYMDPNSPDARCFGCGKERHLDSTVRRSARTARAKR